MIRPLRKGHLQIWTTLAFLLPLGIISAWFAIPSPAIDKIIQPGIGIALPRILETSKAGSDRTFQIRTNADSSVIQLACINERTITTPSALIYQVQNSATADIANADLIGRIAEKGNYFFPLKKMEAKNGFHFIIYDIIHHQATERVDF